MTVKTMRKICRAIAWLSLLCCWGAFASIDHEYIGIATGVITGVVCAAGFIGFGWLGRLFR